MKNNLETEERALKALKECLSGINLIKDYEIERTTAAAPFDLIVKLILPQGEYNMLAEIKSGGEPRILRNAAFTLLRVREEYPESYPLLIAPYVSPHSSKILIEDGVGYIDFAGNCHIEFDNIYVHVGGHKNPFPEKRGLRTVFSPKASRVIRVLLSQGMRIWKIEELAREADVSVGHVFKVKDILKDMAWIEEMKPGFILRAPEELIGEWSRHYNFNRNTASDLYSFENVEPQEKEIMRFCSKNEIRCAFTMFSGASKMVPYARYKLVSAYIDKGMERIRDGLKLKEVDTGSNVMLINPYDEGVFYASRRIAGIDVVSPTQLYLDLKSSGGLGGKTADHLYEKEIAPLWSKTLSPNQGK
ncbi:MAG: hypothetical protein JW854_02765 [Actinobacteria bacterium]|nr:hypothetical protein [Actinomycetota bacterium]